MRLLILLLLCLTATAQAQELAIEVRPDAIYVEAMHGNLTPMDRVFFHMIFHNMSMAPVTIDWVRFDFAGGEGSVLSGQFSGTALTRFFDSSIERRRIEPTATQSLVIGPDERKAISDVFMDSPAGFIGGTLVVEVQYKAGDKLGVANATKVLKRAEGFAGRLPFEGTWYVANEHGYVDPHKRFRAEAFAYDFVQIGANGRSFQRDGSRNSDYYAYSKRVLAAADGVVAYVRNDIIENTPGVPNVNTPGGNVVVIDHGNGQYGYYAHLKPGSVDVRVGARVAAGDELAEVGNSGDSNEPRLHFHVMNNANVDDAEGLPAVFTNWKAQSYGRVPVVREMGLLPRGEFVEP